jgi:predicted nucleic acid-binding protein
MKTDSTILIREDRELRLILDANIIVKLVLNEPGSKEARATITNLLKKGQSICTVDIALAECLNAIWKHVTILKDLEKKETDPTMEDLTRIYDELTVLATRELEIEAIQIAFSPKCANI